MYVSDMQHGADKGQSPFKDSESMDFPTENL